MREWKKLFHETEIKAGVAILVSDKIYVKECNKRQGKQQCLRGPIQKKI